MKVQLFTMTGVLVATVQVPRLSITPEVLVWSGRTFALKTGRYVEVLAYVVIGAAVAA